MLPWIALSYQLVTLLCSSPLAWVCIWSLVPLFLHIQYLFSSSSIFAVYRIKKISIPIVQSKKKTLGYYINIFSYFHSFISFWQFLKKYLEVLDTYKLNVCNHLVTELASRSPGLYLLGYYFSIGQLRWFAESVHSAKWDRMKREYKV